MSTMTSGLDNHAAGFGKEEEEHRSVCRGEVDDSSSGKAVKDGNGKVEVQGSANQDESSKRATSCFSPIRHSTSQPTNLTTHENSPVISVSRTEAASAKSGNENLVLPEKSQVDPVSEDGYVHSTTTEHSQSYLTTHGRPKDLLEDGALHYTSEPCTPENAPLFHAMNNVAEHHTLREYVHENMSGYGTAGWQTDSLAGQRPGTYVHGAVSLNGGYTYGSMMAGGESGRYGEHGENKANAYGQATVHNGSMATAHAYMPMYNESEGEESKITIAHTVSSIEAPSLLNGSGKADSFLPTSPYTIRRSGYLKNLSLISRFGGAIFALLAFSVMISTTEKRIAAGSTFYVRFSDYQAYNYLTAVNLLCFLYSSGQMIILARPQSSSVLSSPIKWEASIYICDQMLAFLMVSSSSSAATASELSLHGLRNIWPPACSTWKLSLFCSKADVAVVMSFFSCVFVLLSSFSSGYRMSSLLAE